MADITMPRQKIYLQPAPRDLLVEEGIGAGMKEYALRLRDLPKEEKPREKLVKYGPAALSVAELFAVVLNVGTKKEEGLTMSRRLLKEYGDSAVVSQKDPAKVKDMLGIPLGKACQVVACFEIGRRFFKAQDGRKPVTLRTAAQVYEYL